MMIMRRFGKTICFMDCTATVDVELYDKYKYDADAAIENAVTYTGVVKYGVFNAADFAPGHLSGIDPDENDEYLKIWLSDDTTATFRNSHVDMFTTDIA